MKKLILSGFFALTLFTTSCKKDYTDFESYTAEYTTVDNKMQVHITASNGLNSVNSTNPFIANNNGQILPIELISVTDNSIDYLVEVKGEFATLYFKKLNGETIRMSMISSPKKLKTNY